MLTVAGIVLIVILAVVQSGVTGSTSATLRDPVTGLWVIGAGDVDPTGSVPEGALFWRTDLKAFRQFTSGVWAATPTLYPYMTTNGAAITTTVPIVSSTATLTFGTSDGTIASVFPLKALTAASATPVVLVGVASGASCGGVLEYSVYVGDATPNYQTRHGAFNFAVVNKAGTETCTVGAGDQTADGSVLAISSGGADTLTYAITCVTTPANGVYLSFNAVSSLTETSLNIKPRINLDPSATGVCTVTAQ
jgi:hypothetical protein